jgi:hypothetical protein
MLRRVPTKNSLAAGIPLLLLAIVLSVQAEAPVAAQTLEALKNAYSFQPAEIRQENPVLFPAENRAEDIILLERMIVMESPAGRGLTESIDKQQAILKQSRFDWEKGGFYYRKIGRKFTIEAGVWSQGPELKLLTVSW